MNVVHGTTVVGHFVFVIPHFSCGASTESCGSGKFVCSKRHGCDDTRTYLVACTLNTQIKDNSYLGTAWYPIEGLTQAGAGG